MSSSPLRVALVGFGTIQSEEHSLVYKKRSDIAVTAVADICPARRDQAAFLYPEAAIYTDAEILLERESEALDFIDLAVPPHAQSEIAQLALHSKVHVLSENPVASSFREAKAILDKAHESDRFFFPVCKLKHSAQFKTLSQEVSQTRIGKIRAVSFQDFREASRGVPEWHADWRRDPTYAGGGVGLERATSLLVPILDWICETPRRVSATQSNLWSLPEEMEDCLSLSLQFDEARVTLEVGWSKGTSHLSGAILGEKGGLSLDRDRVRVTAGAYSETKPLSSAWANAIHPDRFEAALEEWLLAIRRGESPERLAKHTVLAHLIVERAYQSAKEGGKEITIDG